VSYFSAKVQQKIDLEKRKGKIFDLLHLRNEKLVKYEDFSLSVFHVSLFIITFAAAKDGQSCTASSLRILQDGNVAKVVGCSGAM
jgi:hypothetical protein